MRPAPELVIGLVGAVGTPLDTVAGRLEESLSRVAYLCSHIRISQLLDSIEKFRATIVRDPESARLRTTMEAGTAFRETLNRGDALVGLAVTQIRTERERNGGSFEERAYVLRQLKHHEEVIALRDVYREHFILLGVYMPREMRVDRLAERLSRTEGKTSGELRAAAEQLIATDERELGRPLGQDVRETFPMSDVFVNATDAAQLGREIDRFVEILFGKPCMTPTKDECGLFHAQAAALRSSALSRQVGAALLSAEGDVLAVGMNEVPKGGGGHYWAGDEDDGRDFTRGYDQNDELKATVLREVLLKLREAGWLAGSRQTDPIETVLRDVRTPLKDARILGLTEFGRDVHAEMSVLMTAARRGIATHGCTLYTTTFPCHNCAKHIVGAGIAKVIYIEPYAKSFAKEFHPDSIDVESEKPQSGRVLFEPFVGIAPRRFLDWFKAGVRKGGDGRVIGWRPTEQPPIFARPESGGVDIAYPDREREISKRTTKNMEDAGLIEVGR